jgi:hypothetical protein
VSGGGIRSAPAKLPRVTSSFFDKDGVLIFIREQTVSEHDTLANCLRRHSAYAAKHVARNPHAASFTICYETGESK